MSNQNDNDLVRNASGSTEIVHSQSGTGIVLLTDLKYITIAVAQTWDPVPTLPPILYKEFARNTLSRTFVYTFESFRYAVDKHGLLQAWLRFCLRWLIFVCIVLMALSVTMYFFGQFAELSAFAARMANEAMQNALQCCLYGIALTLSLWLFVQFIQKIVFKRKVSK